MTDTTIDTVTLSLVVTNTYELYPTVTTWPTDVVLPAPPSDEDSEDFEAWVQEHIYNLTGVGNVSGDAWYDVEVTACTDPSWVGRTFEFGY